MLKLSLGPRIAASRDNCDSFAAIGVNCESSISYAANLPFLKTVVLLLFLDFNFLLSLTVPKVFSPICY